MIALYLPFILIPWKCKPLLQGQGQLAQVQQHAVSRDQLGTVPQALLLHKREVSWSYLRGAMGGCKPRGTRILYAVARRISIIMITVPRVYQTRRMNTKTLLTLIQYWRLRTQELMIKGTRFQYSVAKVSREIMVCTLTVVLHEAVMIMKDSNVSLKCLQMMSNTPSSVMPMELPPGAVDL